MIQVTHESLKDGKQFAKVAAIMSLPKGTVKPIIEGEPLYFDTEKPDRAVFDKLGKWLKEKIDSALTPEDAIRKMARSGNGDDPGYDAADAAREPHSDIPF